MKILYVIAAMIVSSLALSAPTKGQPNYFPNCKALNKVYTNGVAKSHPAYLTLLTAPCWIATKTAGRANPNQGSIAYHSSADRSDSRVIHSQFPRVKSISREQ